MQGATRAAANDDPDVRMYWRIDPGYDWMDRNTGPSPMPEDARQHPLFVQQLFHICTISRWNRATSYADDRNRLRAGV